MQPSHSGNASLIVLVKKKNGSIRICVDYRQLNRKIIKDRYLLPLIEDDLDSLQGATIFSTPDLIDYEEVFIPVARYDTIRAFLATCVEINMHVHQMDVVTAYVQGDLNEDIYIIQPEMFISKGNENKVCKLNRPLYGLKQTDRRSYDNILR